MSDSLESSLASSSRNIVPAPGSLSTRQLADRIRAEQKQRWEKGERPLAETYLQKYPQLCADTEAVVDIIYHEFLLREQFGDKPEPEEYCRRFPVCAAILQKQIELHRALREKMTASFPSETQTTLPQESNEPSQLSQTTVDFFAPQCLPTNFGRYRILKLLGQGGMGTVYQAQDSVLHRLVALKVIHLPKQQSDQAVQRFYREARAAAALTHPNLCPVYDVGSIEGIHYLTMPFLQGRSLATWLRDGPLPEKTAARFVSLTARALQEAHEAGIIHRDLKPSNLIINDKQEPIVIDFGLAHRSAIQEDRLTPSGGVLGTPAYLAPEQVDDKLGTVSPQTDVYSLGVVLYEILAGRVPFQGTIWEIVNKIRREEPPALGSICPGVAPKLAAICHKAMSKNPKNRFASMGELANALEDFLHQRSESLQPSSVILAENNSTTPPNPCNWRFRFLLIGLCLLVAVGLFTVPWFYPGDNSSTKSTNNVSTPPTNESQDLLQTGSEWDGRFTFRPPIENYSGDVQVKITDRNGETFQGIYSTEGKKYQWHIAGTIRDGKIQWEFTKAVRDNPQETLVGRAYVEGTWESEEMNLVFRMKESNSVADMKLKLQKK